MTAIRVQSVVPMGSASIRLTVLLAAALLACASATMAAETEVDFGRANDYYYYADKASNRLKVVEQYHLGPCEHWLRERAYQQAVAECNFILKIFPNHPQALLLTTQACERWTSPLCRLDDVFQNAVAINPQIPQTFVLQGIYLHRTHQYGKAIESYQHALQLDPNLINAHYNLALTYLETKQFDQANEHAQRAYDLGSTLPGLRDLLIKAGHWNPAPRASVSAPSAAPANPAPTK
jgi:tetratricopeptide (TPR) repeat protein